MEHECTQQAVIGEIHGLLKRIVTEVYGNGSPGISKTIPKLEGSIQNLTSTVAAQTVVIADLIKFQEGLKSVDIYKEKEGLSNRQRAGLYISAIIGASSIATALVIKFA
jgi:hypothetical protein